MDLKVRIWIPILALAVLLIISSVFLIPMYNGERFFRKDPPKITETVSKVGEYAMTSALVTEDLLIMRDCPFVLNAVEAETAERTSFVKGGNKIELIKQPAGRTGNHFMLISGYLAMGFCCRARLVTLPALDDTIPQDSGLFQTKNRWFSFTNITLPWEAYRGLRWNRQICMPDMEDGGDSAFGYRHLGEKLLQCMNRVFLRGCEAAYLGDVLKTSEFCPERTTPSSAGGAGSLVVHIRSGDIFDPEGEGVHRPDFGQPPLEFFLMTMREKEWDDVTIITSADSSEHVNPTFQTLEIMHKAGSFDTKVRFFSERSFQEDLRELLCADAIAASKTSLNYLTFAHSRASIFFLPSECGRGAPQRARRRPWKATYDNTTLLKLERPEAEVYGVEYHEGGSKDYTVYKKWKDTPEQLLEMLTYGGIKGLKRCD